MHKVYKVWNADRSIKKLVKVANLQKLIQHGKKKLNYPESDHVTVVDEIDGTVVEDEDYFSTLPALYRFILLRDSERWKQGIGREFYTDDQTDGEIESSAQSSDMVDVLTMLRQNITKLVTLNRDELQNVVDLQQHNLAHYLDIPDNEAGRIQDKCQQYLDELQDSSEAMDLLRLFKNKDANLVSGSQPSCDDRYKEEHASYQNEPENKRSKY
ncbi:hypothetical protein LSH36_3g15001 [Paralvinella palmiformis]|uniref:CIDE-N domain-containing protein n=1 Tax=Paralvinella palmiformis TaxID=53620 RepID=A0AAD9KFP9_9ANNE|nr:hypothetical protein LSH36_3g15001 [Paralvinella palmiformis]